MFSRIGDAADIKDYGERERKLYQASDAVMLAMETIDGEGAIKDILQTIVSREERQYTPDELFEIVNRQLGFDIRDRDKFISEYKQKAETPEISK